MVISNFISLCHKILKSLHHIVHWYRKSTSSTHVSAVVYCLCSLSPATFILPNAPTTDSNDDCDQDRVPVTSLLCQWAQPRKRKESTVPIAEATFEKYEYAKQVKLKARRLEDFDPRPPEYRVNAATRIPDLLDAVRGEQLCISLLLDSKFVKKQKNHYNHHRALHAPHRKFN